MIRKYYLWITAFVSIIILYFVYKKYEIPQVSKQIAILENNIQAEQIKLSNFLDFTADEVYKRGLKPIKTSLREHDYFLHIYKKDSLIFWNTNQLPILRFADIHYPASGIVHLQNGWYYAQTREVDDYIVCASFLIKQDYPYQNTNLKNDFNPELDFDLNAVISLDMESELIVRDSKENFLFSLADIETKKPNTFNSFLVLCAFLLPIFLLGCILYRFFTRSKLSVILIGISATIVLRFLLLYYDWGKFLNFSSAFQSQLYGANKFSPNFAEFAVHVFLVILIVLTFVNTLRRKLFTLKNYIWLAILVLGSFGFWTLILIANSGLIEHSEIPLSINRLFNLNAFSVAVIFLLGMLMYCYYLFTFSIIKVLHKQHLSGSKLAVILFISGISYLFYISNIYLLMPLAGIFPLLIMGLIAYQLYSEKNNSLYGLSIIYVMFFAFILASNMSEFNRRKEVDERLVYANQLATDQDILTEVEYASLASRIDQDNFLYKFIQNPVVIGATEFHEGLERRVFDTYWERYEMEFYLFDNTGSSLLDTPDENKNTFAEFASILLKYGKQSEVNPELYHIQNNKESYTYIANHTLQKNGEFLGNLLITFKSKKLPEEIGFPQLLISDQAKTLNALQNYSIARYFDNKLSLNYGNFNFPTNIKKFWKKELEKEGFITIDNYNHFIFKKSEREYLIISAKVFNKIDLLTSFSYIFCFFGILLLPYLFRSNKKQAFTKFTLSIKIQLALVALVFLALLGFGFGSGIFVQNQYNNYTKDVISEKLQSVEMELDSKIKSFGRRKINDQSNYLEFWLQKFSRVFVVDINFYNVDGYLVSSSRPRVFNIGLLSEQMNPVALRNLTVKKKSKYLHDENIGNLTYVSAYMPYFNADEKLIGYINLQHFGQQKEFENQIQQFLVAIINVFMLLLAISVIAALFVSNWVTAPLRFLQENFAKLSLNKENTTINYSKNDEIGALVKEYNLKIHELEYAAKQLAQNERESAWREMAKQVAHEIKNPLTPMKLSIQQLMRVYDPQDPKSGEKIKRVSESIIEQIDALTNIANEFSNFAKMPKSTEAKIDLKKLISGVIDVFEDEKNVDINFNASSSEIYVMGDNNALLRVFNNLIKNAIQAKKENDKSEIRIDINTQNEFIEISVSDNGVGISLENQKSLFEPYFTTKSSGTGLGLAMVKQIIENHRGTIRCESETGVGTTFFIELPKIISD